MEKRGIQTNIGNLNREIRAANNLMKSIRQLIQNLKGWITELGEKRKELLAQKAAEEATLLSLIHISEPTRLGMISYAVFCLKKKKKRNKNNTT